MLRSDASDCPCDGYTVALQPLSFLFDGTVPVRAATVTISCTGGGSAGRSGGGEAVQLVIRAVGSSAGTIGPRTRRLLTMLGETDESVVASVDDEPPWLVMSVSCPFVIRRAAAASTSEKGATASTVRNS